MTHLTAQQRYTIEQLYNANYKQKEIARIIKKDKSVISRELKRNRDNNIYKSAIAEQKYQQRLKEKPKIQYFTDEIKKHIESKLSEKWSPETIYQRSKLDGLACVSHETIYQHIWLDKRQGGQLYTHLMNRGKRYRKRGSLKDKRGIITNRTCITERPKIVDEKQRIGDYEGDTIIGKNHKGAILTTNDRVSKKVHLHLLESKEAGPLADAAIKIFNRLPELEKAKTWTVDNGKEFANHQAISESTDIKIYFAKPYHSWERGANENTNRLIRKYLPKQTDFSTITEEQIQYIEDQLNNRPRKALQWLSPNEWLAIYHTDQQIV